MAEAKKQTLEELKKQRAELDKQQADLDAKIQEQLNADRPDVLLTVKELIKTYSFTASELGLTATKATAKTGKVSGTPSKKPLKSSKDNTKVGVWLKSVPEFLTEEGCFDLFASGKSVDQWLVNPSDKGDKANFLAKLYKRAEHEGKAVTLTKEQLGDVTKAEVEKVVSKLKK